jgi:hypothetical protein
MGAESQAREEAEVNEFDYLIFVNDAKSPLAGFACRDDAVLWVESKRWGGKWKIEIRRGGEPLLTLFASPLGHVAVADEREVEK